MSRIGKLPISVPGGVQVSINGTLVSVKGPLGALLQDTLGNVDVSLTQGKVLVQRKSDDKQDKAYHGLYHRLISNMINGVTNGYKKELEIVGVGYKAQMEGNTLIMQLGYSHPVKIQSPAGIKIEVPKPTSIIVSGFDKQLVGEIAARIRKSHLPEPYKGKGVRYVGEHIRRKVGKTGAK